QRREFPRLDSADRGDHDPPDAVPRTGTDLQGLPARNQLELAHRHESATAISYDPAISTGVFSMPLQSVAESALSRGIRSLRLCSRLVRGNGLPFRGFAELVSGPRRGHAEALQQADRRSRPDES